MLVHIDAYTSAAALGTLINQPLHLIFAVTVIN